MKGKTVGKVLKYVLSLLLAAVLLYFAFRGADFAEFLQGVLCTRWGLILLSLIPSTLALVFRTERWHLQLTALDPQVRRADIWHGSNIGNFLNIVVPGLGEFYRCAHVKTGKATYTRTFGTIIVERAWDLLAVFFLLSLALALNTETLAGFVQVNIVQPFLSRFNFSLWVVAVVFFALVAFLLWSVYRLRTRNRVCAMFCDLVKGLFKGIASFGKMRHKWFFLLCTAGVWLMYILMAWFTILAIPQLSDIGFADATFISTVGNIASVIPTPGNLGAYHYLVGMAVSNIYQGASAMTSSALLFATLSHGVHALLLIFLGAVSYFVTTFRKKGR